MTDFTGTDQSTPRTTSLFRRDLLFGLAGVGLASLTISCVSQQVGGSALKNGVDRPVVVPGLLVQPAQRLAQVGQVLTAANPSTTKWKYGIASKAELVANLAAGHSIMVSGTLIELCENDGQIGAVLAQRMALTQLASQGRSPFRFATPLNLAPTTIDQVDAISQADVAAIGALARAGYDPRDFMVIWHRIGRTNGDGMLPHATRLAAMAAELRKLGYQV